LAVLAVALSGLATGAVRAGEAAVPTARTTGGAARPPWYAPAPPAPSGRFPRQHIVTRSTAHLQFLTATAAAPRGIEALDPEMFGDMAHAVRQSAQQAGRVALRAEARRLIDLSAPPGFGRTRALGREGRLAFQADLHHALPELEAHYRLPHGALKLGLALDGSAGVLYRDDRMSRLRVWGGFDGRDSWQLLLRFGF